MHDHETCERLMAEAQRAGKTGRLEYLATRCDMRHGEQNVPNEQEEAS